MYCSIFLTARNISHSIDRLTTINFGVYLDVRICDFFSVSLARARVWLLANGQMVAWLSCFCSFTSSVCLTGSCNSRISQDLAHLFHFESREKKLLLQNVGIDTAQEIAGFSSQFAHGSHPIFQQNGYEVRISIFFDISKEHWTSPSLFWFVI